MCTTTSLHLFKADQAIPSHLQVQGWDNEYPEEGSSGFTAIYTHKLSFLDVCNYLLAGSFSYAKYFRTYVGTDCQGGKSFLFMNDCLSLSGENTHWKRAWDDLMANGIMLSCAGSGSARAWLLFEICWYIIIIVTWYPSWQTYRSSGMSTSKQSCLARPVMCTRPSSWTSWHTWGPVPGTQCGNAAKPFQVYNEKTPGLFRTNWDGDGMVTLSSKTSYYRDSQGKLSSKGLQKKANTDSLTYHLQSCLQGTWMAVSTTASRPDPVGKCIPIGRGHTALSYVYLKRRVAEDGIHTEPLHLWAAHGLPAYLSAIWPHPAPLMLANMRCMTCDYSGLFVCSSLAVPGLASPRWPLD